MIALAEKEVTTMTKAPSKEILEQRIIEGIKTVYDPEIPVNVYELGLIYDIDINKDYYVNIRMTLTAPACPVAGILPEQVATAARGVTGVSDAAVELVWDPPWTTKCMSEVAKLELGFL